METVTKRGWEKKKKLAEAFRSSRHADANENFISAGQIFTNELSKVASQWEW